MSNFKVVTNKDYSANKRKSDDILYYLLNSFRDSFVREENEKRRQLKEKE